MASAVDLKRRGAVLASLTAGAVLAVMLAQSILLGLTTMLVGLGYADVSGSTLPTLFASASYAALIGALPFAAGVFLSLWQFAPIGRELRFAHVISRSVLAAAVGSGLTFVVSLIAAFAGALASGGAFNLLQNAFPLARVTDGIGQAFLVAGQTTAVAFITTVPLVALAAVGLWVWVREREPSYRVEGALDL